MDTLAIVLAVALVLAFLATSTRFMDTPHAVFDFAVTLVLVLVLLGVVA